MWKAVFPALLAAIAVLLLIVMLDIRSGVQDLQPPKDVPSVTIEYPVIQYTHPDFGDRVLEVVRMPGLDDAEWWAAFAVELDRLRNEDELTAKATCWKWSGGEITVTTPPIPGETEEHQCDRHDASVEHGQELHPSTGECEPVD